MAANISLVWSADLLAARHGGGRLRGARKFSFKRVRKYKDHGTVLLYIYIYKARTNIQYTTTLSEKTVHVCVLTFSKAMLVTDVLM